MKIQDHHRTRLAIVYVRQSTPRQIVDHRESAALQYSLAGRAEQYGWPRDRVLIIGDYQGQSGRSADGRLGFQRLLAEVGLNHVGLVLGIEMSRLTRSAVATDLFARPPYSSSAPIATTQGLPPTKRPSRNERS